MGKVVAHHFDGFDRLWESTCTGLGPGFLPEPVNGGLEGVERGCALTETVLGFVITNSFSVRVKISRVAGVVGLSDFLYILTTQKTPTTLTIPATARKLRDVTDAMDAAGGFGEKPETASQTSHCLAKIRFLAVRIGARRERIGMVVETNMLSAGGADIRSLARLFSCCSHEEPPCS